MGRRPKLTDHQRREAIKRRDHGEETLAEIGRSYNVSGWTLAAVALANKMARIAWTLMVTGNSYAAKSAPAALMGAA